ncbi:hypothetical protein EI168_17115 [Halomonas sp. FME1]|uniref:Transposase n=1 Tax=Halomonas casei TaxID=2742613 RepID=A0ABR9F5U3_9GAMM|nr:hypothetical protein [Halomonas casei]MBE0401805.1 hypothetical protein [Halomonas casei]
MPDFDAHKELERIHALRKRRQIPKYWRGRSQLDRHSGKLLEMHDLGASANDLRVWLKETQRLSVDRSTVCRWLQKATAKRRDYLNRDNN